MNAVHLLHYLVATVAFTGYAHAATYVYIFRLIQTIPDEYIPALLKWERSACESRPLNGVWQPAMYHCAVPHLVTASPPRAYVVGTGPNAGNVLQPKVTMDWVMTVA